jgi:hypothetical protein
LDFKFGKNLTVLNDRIWSITFPLKLIFGATFVRRCCGHRILRLLLLLLRPGRVGQLTNAQPLMLFWDARTSAIIYARKQQLQQDLRAKIMKFNPFSTPAPQHTNKIMAKFRQLTPQRRLNASDDV